MSKVGLKELNKELANCRIGIDYDSIDLTPSFCVYHCHNWNHGYESCDGIEVYSDGSYAHIKDVSYKGSRREFYSDLRDITSFVASYMDYCSITEFIVAPCYRYNQFTSNASQNDIYYEIRSFLKSHKIRKGERSGVRLPYNGNMNTIEMIMEGAFRGISELCVFFPRRNLLLSPNHHFELMFFSHNLKDELHTCNLLLSNFENLRIFTGINT